MKILLANPRGFCAGVNMAIQTVEEALKIVGTPLYVYHEIVHNRHVVDQFVKEGVVFVDGIEDVPGNSTVIFSAHGVSPAVRNAAKKRGCTMIDATCPLVTKVHMEAIRYARQGYNILLIGHAGHDEVEGTVGEAPNAITIVESPEDVENLPFTTEDKIAYITQTTLSRDDAERIIGAIKKKYPNAKIPPSEDICYATTNRQDAIRSGASDADMVLVVGSKNSSNSVRLMEIAHLDGTPAKLLDDKSELDHDWFHADQTVVITAGASAPEHLVQEIVSELLDIYGGEVEEFYFVEEDMHFNLPVTLRVLRGDQTIGA
jgi:4-hydroxy-3-methylbut-2-enyl diphosphate reductase